MTYGLSSKDANLPVGIDRERTDVRLTAVDTLNHLLNLEMSLFLGEADQADNKRNGSRDRDYTIKGIGTVRLNVPKDRKSRFQSAIVKKSERIDPRIKEDLAFLHLAGIRPNSGHDLEEDSGD